jgi:hypothetical protein
MYRFKKQILIMVVCALFFGLFTVSNASVISENETYQNPYIQEYLKEKDNVSKSKDNLVNEQAEEKEIISTLNEYYNEDIKVANIINKYYTKSDLSTKALSVKKEDKIIVMKAIKERSRWRGGLLN